MKDPFQPPEWTGKPVLIGTMWTLHKGTHKVVCDLVNHPLGGEMRCFVDDELFATKAGREIVPLLDASDEWKSGFLQKGWN